jgi:hypothetical protein
MATDTALSQESRIIDQLSARPLSATETSALTVLLDQMQAAYPHQEFTDETAAVWREALKVLVARHGITRLRAVLAEFLVRPGQKFFPHPSEISEALEAMQTQERRRILRENPFTACGLNGCVDGLVRVNRDGSLYDWRVGGPSALRDCACKLAWRQRVNSDSVTDAKPAPASRIVRMPYKESEPRGAQ